MTLIETLADVKPGSALAEAMENRAEILRLSEAAHNAVLLPRDPGGLSHGLRAALAARMARHNSNEALADHYDTLVDRAAESETSLLAQPGTNLDDARTSEIVRHADRLTLAPRESTRGHIEALRSAGVTDADIVRLSELAAFVNYQVRVIAGLKLIGARK
ncbi:CMD domain-containing protein [Rhizobium sp. NPDC090275]|uniref:CMD domain-containing protein n=1 Tax=Rhizobium sp. NPDC090275 TaxID=3364498 RepID=UPI00383BC0C9